MAKLMAPIVAAAAVPSSRADPYLYTVSGACDAQGFINGYSFLRMGTTASGAPWYKAIDAETYLFYDPDCMGSTDGTPRWILDTDKPDVTAKADLDKDNFCDYIARIDSTDIMRPPTQGLWTMNCGGRWEQQYLILLEGTTTPRFGVPSYPATTTMQFAAYVPPGDSLKLSGLCPMKSYLNDLVYVKAGTTLDGRPFFEAAGRTEYLYFDQDCDGQNVPGGSGRWILDNSRPDTTVFKDLDQDGKCDYHARFDGVSASPPAAGMWKVYCGDAGWASLDLTLSEAQAQKQQINSSPRAAAPLLAAVASVLAWAIGM